MPRSLRVEYPGACYHAMCRGNNGQEIFLNDDGRKLYFATLEEVCTQTGWRVHAYVLMSNHYHLLLETPEANLVEGMKWFQGTYTQRFNAMFKRRGHLYQGRYKAIPIDTHPLADGLDYFREVSSYIHLNPFRAGLAGEGMKAALESYRWSSYPAYCGQLRKLPDWLERNKVLSSWELTEGKSGRLRMYREKMEAQMRLENDPAIAVLGDVHQQIRRGWYLGSEDFKERLDQLLLGRANSDNCRGAQRRDHSPAEAERLLTLALRELQWTEHELVEAKSVVLEKQAVAWLLKTYTTVTGQWIADRLKMGHRVNASRAIGHFRKDNDRTVRRLKKRMLKCTG